LHLACAVALFSLLNGSPAPPPSVTYIDLNPAQHAAPAAPTMAVPPQAAPAPKLAPEPESPQLPEPPPQAQKSAAPADQPVAAPREPRAEEKLPHTTLGLGLAKGYFATLGEGETLRVDIKEYYLEMLQHINEKWWLDQQLDKKNIRPVVLNITVARNGEILASAILRGSGNSRYDQAVLAALTAASPLPPLPAKYIGDTFQAPVRLMPPLELMAW